MKRATICSLFVSLIAACSAHAQSKLSVKWEELTAADFREAIQLSKGTCLLPFGILAKHRAQLERLHDYVVYVLDGERSRPGGPPKKSTGIDYHAGENETSNTMVSRPDLVHIERAATESGIDQKRTHLPEDVYTGIWWYARFPNHYSGDGSVATRELGEWNMNNWIAATVEAIRTAKADDQSLQLHNEFYEKSKHPLDTRP